MKLHGIHTKSDSTRHKIVDLLKRNRELSVADIASELQMSYMGIKEACINLANSGVLSQKRESSNGDRHGRPRLLYYLTEHGHDYFETASDELTLAILESAQRLYGITAAEKLLHVTWQAKTESYIKALAQARDTRQRIEQFMKRREREGYMPRVSFTTSGSIVFEEFHCPYQSLIKRHPCITRLEAEMFTHIFKTPVERIEDNSAKYYRVVYQWNV
jgi:predicted ArsR family transcriptional regulator